MPDIIEAGNNAGFKTLDFPNENYVAFTIHPASLIDCCVINGQHLVVGGVVHVGEGARRAEIDPIRLNATDGGQYLAEINTPLVLQAWRCGERVVPARMRAPYLEQAVWKTGTGGGGETGGAGARGTLTTIGYTRMLRLPFQGRRHASFTARIVGGTLGTSQMTYIVRGISYIPRAFTSVLANSLVDESATTVDTFTDSTTNAATLEQRATTINVGGFDSEEHYDEIELWGKITSAAWNGDVIVLGRAAGESNQ